MSPAPHRRRRVLHRWFEERVLWTLLDARDWLLRRDRTKPLYEPHHPTLRMRLRWRLQDTLPEWLLAPRMRGFAHAHRGGVLAFVALPVVVAAAIGGFAIGFKGGSSSGPPAQLASEPVPRSGVKGVSANSADEAKAEKAKPDQAAKRRDRAAARRAAAKRRDRAAARRHRAAVRKRAAARRRHKHKAPARVAPATPVSTPAPQHANPTPAPPARTPSRPSTPSRPPSHNGGGGSQPPTVNFDSTG